MLVQSVGQLVSFTELLRTKLAPVLAADKNTQVGSLYGERYLRRLLWYLLGGTRGGANRTTILKILQDRPSNANQLAEALRVDYKTIQHHLRVLEENGLVAPSEKGAYGAVLFLHAKDGRGIAHTRRDLEQNWKKQDNYGK